jgi:hypothetical protein
MKKYAPAVITLFLLISSHAFTQKEIKGLISAEKAFAAFTEKHTIREGFLQYMDSAGIIFRQGVAVNALEVFQKQKPGPAVLSWWPAFAVISASGDMGITSGPYELRTKSIDDTIAARGSFSSIWHISKQGIWKNLADLGVSYKQKYAAPNEVRQLVLTAKPVTVNSVFDVVLEADKKLNTAIREKNTEIIAASLSSDSWLNIEGETPFKNPKTINDALLKIPGTVLLQTQTGEIAASGDLAYIYGSVTNADKKENYLRAWIYSNNKWQVIMQTIKW